MEALEISAKTIEEAIELALDELKLTRSEVEIEIVQEGKSGLLGWGGEEAKIKVKPLATAKEGGGQESKSADSTQIAAIAKEVVENLLSLLNVPATVEVEQPADDESPITLNISGEDAGILIGRRGQTLAAIQYMVNFITSRKVEGAARTIIDVAGYRKRRNEELQSLASRIGELVKSNSRSITLEPMPALERRIIHLALKDDPDLTTQSIGFGDARKVVVYPESQNLP